MINENIRKVLVDSENSMCIGSSSIRCSAWCTLLLILFANGLAAQETVSVRIQPIQEVLVDLERSAAAEVLAMNRAVIAAEVSGVVQAIRADVGAEVKQGDLLLEIDPADYRLALQQAEASLATSKAQKAQADVRLQRAKQLTEGNYLSADDLLARETEAQVANSQILLQEAAVAIARRNLQKCRIVAPFNGVVSTRMAQTGSYVSIGNPLLEFSETDRYELTAEIPDELADSLALAEKIEFQSRNETWPVELLRLSPVIETERRSRSARFQFIGNAPAIGRSGEVFWRVSRGLMPASLIVQRNGLLGIFLYDNGTARFTPLPNAQEGRPVPVQLPIDSMIVVTGRDRLQDGDQIKPQ
jgi:RND family efflux transporter MFP subunit